jgi:hypothetical protein
MPRHKTHTVTRRSRTNETLSVDEITQTRERGAPLKLGAVGGHASRASSIYMSGRQTVAESERTALPCDCWEITEEVGRASSGNAVSSWGKGVF